MIRAPRSPPQTYRPRPPSNRPAPLAVTLCRAPAELRPSMVRGLIAGLGEQMRASRVPRIRYPVPEILLSHHRRLREIIDPGREYRFASAGRRLEVVGRGWELVEVLSILAEPGASPETGD